MQGKAARLEVDIKYGRDILGLKAPQACAAVESNVTPVCALHLLVTDAEIDVYSGSTASMSMRLLCMATQPIAA